MGTGLPMLLTLLIVTCVSLVLSRKYVGTIEKVIDGDTIIADLNLGLGVILDDQYIRFYGIDAWETRGEERPQGLIAKQYVIDCIASAVTVEVEIRPEWGSKGKGSMAGGWG